jgi:uncharacterized membrane protein
VSSVTPKTEKSSHPGSDPLAENIKAVASLQQNALERRSRTARASDFITSVAASDASVILHGLWFGGWLIVNCRLTPWEPFDPYPFNLLNSVVSLEAIFLALFVLASQNRLTREADKRAHLDLQVNLIAEREMTLVLRMLQELCTHFKLGATTRSDEFRALIKETNVQELAEKVEQGLDDQAAQETPAKF